MRFHKQLLGIVSYRSYIRKDLSYQHNASNPNSIILNEVENIERSNRVKVLQPNDNKSTATKRVEHANFGQQMASQSKFLLFD